MTRRTYTSKLRHYEVIDNKVVRRATPIAPMPSMEKPCEYCKKPMFISRGQIARFHGECRKDAKKAIRKRKLIYTK